MYVTFLGGSSRLTLGNRHLSPGPVPVPVPCVLQTTTGEKYGDAVCNLPGRGAISTGYLVGGKTQGSGKG